MSAVIDLQSPPMKAVAAMCGKFLYKLVACAIADIQGEWMGEGDGSGPFPYDPDKGYETLENLVSASPDKKRTRLVTVATEVKQALAALFGCLAAAASEGGKLPAQDVRGHLLGLKQVSRAREVRFLVRAAEAVRIPEGELSRREFGATAAFGDKLRGLVEERDLVSPGAGALARVFVQFLKVVAYRASAFICEMKATLNLKFFLGLVKDFRGFPGVELEEETMMFLRDRVARAAKKAPAAVPAVADSAAELAADAAGLTLESG